MIASRHGRKLRRWPLRLFLGALALFLLLAGWALWNEYHLRAARSLAETRDFSRALAALDRCSSFGPGSGTALFLKARIVRRLALYKDAQRLLDRKPQTKPSEKTEVADLYKESAVLLEECKAAGYDPDALALERIFLQAQRGDVGSVEKYLRSCLEDHHPETLLILEALAQGFLKNFRLTEAVACLDQWLQLQPDTAPALIWRAEARERLRQHSDSLRDYTRAVELEPDYPGSRLRLAGLLLQVNQPAEALKHYRYLFGQRPEDPAVLVGLARCHRALGQAEEGRPFLERLLAQEPHHAEGLAALGQLELESQRLAEAECWLCQAVAEDPSFPDAIHNLSRCLELLGKAEEAKKWRTRLQTIDKDFARLKQIVLQVQAAPHDPAPRYEAGVIFLRNGQDQDGLSWLASALQQDPDHQPTHQALADYYEKHQQTEKAAYHRAKVGQRR
jgi:tetratricopeptide (TPR) repeat protein